MQVVQKQRHRRSSVKKVFLKISQILRENPYGGA